MLIAAHACGKKKLQFSVVYSTSRAGRSVAWRGYVDRAFILNMFRSIGGFFTALTDGGRAKVVRVKYYTRLGWLAMGGRLLWVVAFVRCRVDCFWASACHAAGWLGAGGNGGRLGIGRVFCVCWPLIWYKRSMRCFLVVAFRVV